MDPLFTLAGFVVGLCVGLTGVGGGALMTPILVMGFGIPAALAVGTDLVYAAITKASGVWFHGRKASIRWRLVAHLAIGSLPAALITVVLLDQMVPNGSQERLISLALGITLMFTSLILLLKERISRGVLTNRSRVAGWIRRHRSRLLVLLGALLGVLVTLSSVGAGALTAAILFLLYPRIPAIAIVGTDLAHAVPLAAVAGAGHLQLGNVDLILLGSLLLGSIPGTALGSQLGIHLPEQLLRRGLAGLLFLTGLKFAF
ncbi:sulfite exporter TauE/SafE family protein [Sedimenticola thiotaurini]|uniref:Probable membrane transporter protein n=1 Tax=Sedimenticola thiotaurini TaxID=1543721 RepID=A0A0F7JUD2_9GAMM|nr:sulfite exporter TauE/SafE family protein [Sedimenticola thiotaurini]AKH20166.1 membrane protein [Sedimenticola thiotaurini]